MHDSFVLALLLSTITVANSIRCYQGRDGTANDVSWKPIDCPESFPFCLKREFRRQEEKEGAKVPTYRGCGGPPECSAVGNFNIAYDEKKFAVNMCCDTELCNGSFSTVPALTLSSAAIIIVKLYS